MSAPILAASEYTEHHRCPACDTSNDVLCTEWVVDDRGHRRVQHQWQCPTCQWEVDEC